MTIIVGYVDPDGEVWLGSDSLKTSGREYRYQGSFPKILRAGPWLIGLAGSAMMFRLLQLRTDVIAGFEYPGQIGDFMVGLAKEFAFKPEEEAGRPPAWGNSCVIASVDGLWEMGGDGTVWQCDESFVAIGSGSAQAEGAGYALKVSDFPIAGDDVVKVCLEAACAYDTACGGELVILKAEAYIPENDE